MKRDMRTFLLLVILATAFALAPVAQAQQSLPRANTCSSLDEADWMAAALANEQVVIAIVNDRRMVVDSRRLESFVKNRSDVAGDPVLALIANEKLSAVQQKRVLASGASQKISKQIFIVGAQGGVVTSRHPDPGGREAAAFPIFDDTGRDFLVFLLPVKDGTGLADPEGSMKHVNALRSAGLFTESNLFRLYDMCTIFPAEGQTLRKFEVQLPNGISDDLLEIVNRRKAASGGSKVAPTARPLKSQLGKRILSKLAAKPK